MAANQDSCCEPTGPFNASPFAGGCTPGVVVNDVCYTVPPATDVLTGTREVTIAADCTTSGVVIKNSGGVVVPGAVVAACPPATGGSSLDVQDDGVAVASGVTCLNFTGAGVTATVVGACVNVNIPGGGAGVAFPLLAPNGSCAAPSYSFTADPTSGLLRLGTGEIVLASTACSEQVSLGGGVVDVLATGAGTAQLRSTAGNVNVTAGADVNLTAGTSLTGTSQFTSMIGTDSVLVRADTNNATVQANNGDVNLTALSSDVNVSALATFTVTTNSVLRLTIEPDGSWNVGGSNGTAGQVLTSNGAAAAPTWQAAGGGSPALYDDNPVAHVAPAANGNNSVAIGSGATVNAAATNSFALGTTATVGAAALNSVAIGTSANATGLTSVALGNGTGAVGTSAVAIGDSSGAAGARSVALGIGALATAVEAIAIGDVAAAGSVGSIAIGDAATVNASATGAIAIGDGANTNAATALRAIAIGNAAVALGQEGIAIGDVASSGTADATIAIGDAATVGNGALNGIAIGDASSVAANAQNSLAIGPGALITGVALRSVSIGNAAQCDTVNEAVAIGDGARVTNTRGIAIGDTALAGGDSSVRIGVGGNSGGATSIAIGESASSGGARAIAIGPAATSAGGQETIAIGDAANAGTSVGAIAIGDAATVNNAATGSIAIGDGATVGAFANTVALGAGSTPVAANQVMLGNGSTISIVPGANNAVILGASTLTFSAVYALSVNSTGDLGFQSNSILRFTIESDGSWNIGGSNGTAGQVLTSNGSAAAPTWQAAGGGGGSVTAINAAMSPYTVLSTDQTITVDTSGGNVTLTLEAAPANARKLIVKKTTTDANVMTLARNGMSIEGAVADFATAGTGRPAFEMQFQTASSTWWFI